VQLRGSSGSIGKKDDRRIMGFFSDIISATVKTALTPVAIVKDVVNIATDQEPDATKSLLESAVEDAESAMNEITGG
jgi:hypothetical protein